MQPIRDKIRMIAPLTNSEFYAIMSLVYDAISDEGERNIAVCPAHLRAGYNLAIDDTLELIDVLSRYSSDLKTR